MRKIEKSIHELLYHQDSLIIPGLGTIVSKNAPASIHPVQHIFEPPKKILQFVPAPDIKDDILTEHLSAKSDLKHDAVIKELSGFVHDLRTRLNKNKFAEWASIGKFYLDVENHLQFSPVESTNYLLSSFGLSPFMSPPIIRRSNSIYETDKKNKSAGSVKKKFNWFRFWK
ncbi:MAG: hypothetical protein H0W62_06195 [Chitinophagales bacterium]|nr:hypothetical protein [Chitinophagales bacterium]